MQESWDSWDDKTMAMGTVVTAPQRYAAAAVTNERNQRVPSAGLAADVGQRLTTGESALLLGAFATLAASMASFMAL